MVHYGKIYREFILAKFSSRMAYRVDFIVSILAIMIFQLTGPFLFAILYSRGADIPGWTFGEMLVLFGFSSIVRGVGFLFYANIFWHTVDYVKAGKLDLFLVKPLPVLTHLFFDAFDEEDVGQILMGIVITCLGLYLSGFTVGGLLIALLLLVLATVFLFAFILLISAVAIRFVEVMPLFDALMAVVVYSGYPKTIFSKTGQFAVMYIVPLAIAGFYPAEAVLGRSMEGLLGVIVSVLIFTTVSYLIWRRALHNYQSAGG